MEKEQIRLLKQVLNEPEKHVKALNSFKEAYEGLQIDDQFSSLSLIPGAELQKVVNVLSDVIENGLFNITKRFKEAATAQLDKSGITSPLLKSNLLKGCEEVVSQFKRTIDGLVQSAIDVNKKDDFDRITSKQMTVKLWFLGGYTDLYNGPDVKRLKIVNGGAGIQTECGKSIDVGSSSIEIMPSKDTYYVYFKWPRSGGQATVCVFTEPQSNTDTDFFIFWKSGTFETIVI